jgi:hypothetical protein
VPAASRANQSPPGRVLHRAHERRRRDLHGEDEAQDRLRPRTRYYYQRRLATAEPVFANIRAAKRLDRFTRRGKTKVNAQWLLYCLVHNIGKIQRYGPTLAPSG